MHAVVALPTISGSAANVVLIILTTVVQTVKLMIDDALTPASTASASAA